MLVHLVRSVGFNQESIFDINLNDIRLKPAFQEKMMKKNDVGIDIISNTPTYLPF